jgi:hypothetical protein
MAAIYTFGSFKLNAELDVLSRGEQPLPLGRRAVVQTQDREGAWHRLPASSLATADEVTE